MKTLILVLLSIAGYAEAATTYTVPALTGASIQATINSANSAGNGNTVLLPAGQYNIASTISVPCSSNLTITGPVATPATAVLNATFGGNDIFTLSGCSGITIQYLQFKNTGGIFLGNASASHISILHNQFYGLPSSIGGASNASAAVYFSGSINTTVDSTTIEYNTFGDANSCTAVFATTTDEGGYCAGFFNSAGILSNAVIDYNTFNHVEEGLHLHQITNYSPGATASTVNNVQIQYNYCVGWHRICMEIQTDVVGTAISVTDNAYANPINPSYGTMYISMACCQFGRTFGSAAPNPPQHADANLLYTQNPQTVGSFYAPVIGIECWGGAGTTCNNNLIEGAGSNGIAWGFANGTPWYVQNNYICQTHNGTYITDEEASTSPVISGNTTGTTCAQQTSSAPSISPAAGTYMSPPIITLTNAGRNTSTYYTTDGSTPVPGSGTTQLYTAPFAITMPVTIKSVGMWGVAPQPYSYPAPYGYVPSAIQSASYTSAGGVTLSSVAMTNTGGVHSLVTGTALQMSVTCTYSNGSSSDCTHTDSQGDGVSGWFTSAPSILGINGSGLATAIAVGAAQVTATVAGLTTPAFALTATAPAVTLRSVALATTGGIATLAVSGVNQLLATCTYSDGSTTNCATIDGNGSVVTAWTSTAPGVATVSASGIVTGTGPGSTTLSATVTPANSIGPGGNVASNTVPLTVAAAAPTLVSASLVNAASTHTMILGSTLQFSAHCLYSDSSTTDCSVADVHGNAVTGWLTSDSTTVTINSMGLATAVGAGSPSLTAAVGAVTSSAWPLTITVPAVTLTGLSLAAANGVTGLFVGQNVALVATCSYSDGSTTNCTTTDSHGNIASSYLSSAPTHATVNAATGLVRGIAPGATTFTALAGGVPSAAIPLTVLATPSGVYQITIMGPVRFSGRVTF